jgi:hypothetical protein
VTAETQCLRAFRELWQDGINRENGRFSFRRRMLYPTELRAPPARLNNQTSPRPASMAAAEVSPFSCRARREKCFPSRLVTSSPTIHDTTRGSDMLDTVPQDALKPSPCRAWNPAACHDARRIQKVMAALHRQGVVRLPGTLQRPVPDAGPSDFKPVRATHRPPASRRFHFPSRMICPAPSGATSL